MCVELFTNVHNLPFPLQVMLLKIICGSNGYFDRSFEQLPDNMLYLGASCSSVFRLSKPLSEHLQAQY